MKYDFKMEVDESTSVGKIVAHIKEDSDVLEFGPGNGRMTNYLLNEKKCRVSIVELDEELYNYVSQFSTDSFFGNIDEDDWMNYFEGKKFDYILFADVLEHLMNPESVLRKVKKFLKEDGQILITFPNIAHNSVLIDLFNNKLNWRETGLLDATHKSFFVQDSFENLFSTVGLFVAKEDFTFNQVGYNELDARYEDLPIEVRSAFKGRAYGEVYQYFYALSLHSVPNPERTVPENSSYVKNVHFLLDCGDEKIERDIQVNNQTGENKSFEIDIPTGINILKIFPSLTGTVLDLEVTLADKTINSTASNAVFQRQNHFFFADDQVPVIEFANKKQLAGKKIKVNVNYFYEGNFSELTHELISYAIEQREAKNMLKQKKNFIKKKNNATNYKKVSLPKFESLISMNLDDISYNPEEKTTTVRGWAYSKSDKMPLEFSVSAEKEISYHVLSEYRRDVIDMFELQGDQDYGFTIEIKDPSAQPVYFLDITMASNKRVQYRVEMPNRVQSGTKSARMIRSIQNRGLLGSLKWYFKRKEQKEEKIDITAILAEIKTFAYQPKISVVVPVYNVEEKWLEACVSSLKNQFYENWELCLADDASPSEYIKPLLETYAASDSRIKVIFRKENGHISEATNSALSISTGEFIGFMDNDDELAPQALYEIVKAVNENATIDFIYTDEDKITENGKKFNAFYKSKWNPELLLSHNYITHFVVLKRQLLEKVGGLNTAFNGSQDYDFVLRATEKAQNIAHIPGVMYHWRAIESSTALNPDSKGYAYEAGRCAVQAAMSRRGITAEVEIAEFYGSYKIRYKYDTIPTISIILTNNGENLDKYIHELISKTIYEKFEIILSENQKSNVTIQNDKLIFMRGNTRDELIRQSKSEYIVFLNTNLLPTKSNWLTEMLNLVQQERIGLVTGRIVDYRYRVENVGMSIDLENKQLIFSEKGTPGKSLGYYYRIALPRNIQGATEGCMILKKEDYLETEGLNESLGRDIMGVDFSLQILKKLKKEIVYCSYAIFKEKENAKPYDKSGDFKELLNRWTEEELLDPYRNPKHQ